MIMCGMMCFNDRYASRQGHQLNGMIAQEMQMQNIGKTDL